MWVAVKELGMKKKVYRRDKYTRRKKGDSLASYALVYKASVTSLVSRQLRGMMMKMKDASHTRSLKVCYQSN